MNKVLKFTFQLAGFTIVGLLFFVWYLGYRKNNASLFAAMDKGNNVLQANTTTNQLNTEEYSFSGSDYNGPAYAKPPKVANQKLGYGSNTAGEPIAEATASPNRVKTVRKWEGVHRDQPFADKSYERFGDLITELSEEHGLYPDVFMSRVIAYSYDFVLSPVQDPYDKNFTAMKKPDGTGRARFKNAFESLKAYAVVNAGEITRLSQEGALAKHERSWTMQKIIDNNLFIQKLNAKVPSLANYAGKIGKANDISEEAIYEKEVVGEAIKMTAKVDEGVRQKKAEEAGFTTWKEYMDELSEDEQIAEEKETKEIISAVSKKKALHLKRRVAAKKQKPTSK